VLVFVYLATYHISETQYLTGEEGVVVPVHVVEEYDLAGKENLEAPATKSGATAMALNEIQKV